MIHPDVWLYTVGSKVLGYPKSHHPFVDFPWNNPSIFWGTRFRKPPYDYKMLQWLGLSSTGYLPWITSTIGWRLNIYIYIQETSPIPSIYHRLCHFLSPSSQLPFLCKFKILWSQPVFNIFQPDLRHGEAPGPWGWDCLRPLSWIVEAKTMDPRGEFTKIHGIGRGFHFHESVEDDDFTDFMWSSHNNHGGILGNICIYIDVSTYIYIYVYI